MSGTLEYEMIRKVRRLFRALAARSDDILKRFGLTVAERAVLEFLNPDKAMTVPQIARRFQVSRQHIQVNVNALLGRGYLLQQDNPDHARSPLYGLTEKGLNAFAAVTNRENDMIGELFHAIPAAELVVAARVLTALTGKAENDLPGEEP